MSNVSVWVLSDRLDQGCLERLGDAARLAHSMDCQVGVALLNQVSLASGKQTELAVNQTKLTSEQTRLAVNRLFEYGADLVRVPEFTDKDAPHCRDDSWKDEKPTERISPNSMVRAFRALLKDQPTKVIFVGGDPASREWGSLMAVESGWDWISPVLMARYRSNQLRITRLDQSGRLACQISSTLQSPVIVSIRDGVAEAMPKSPDRSGILEKISTAESLQMIQATPVPVDPTEADIRDCKRLISGGRGLGSAAGFDLLRRVARQLDAGLAASRMAVDQGWIEYERQVGQTGKTVQPDLYIACGISGASHHLDGMSSTKHIVAINLDSEAPIMKVAHLKLSADLHSVLNQVSLKLHEQGRGDREGME